MYFARLQRTAVLESQLASLREETAARTRRRLELASLANDPTVAALRKLFRAAGCDPTRYRPSSEALIRRILKGAELPAINSLVDINNCLSLNLAVPCCVMAEEAVQPDFTFRSGLPGESYESLKGPFNLEGKPLLADALGPCDVPITGSQRVKIQGDTRTAILVAYLPRETVPAADAHEQLEILLKAAPAAQNLGSCYRPAEAEESEENQDG